MADATDLQIDVIKRGAATHVRECDLLINAVQRARRAANYTAGTGKEHHDDAKAHAAVKRAYNRLMRYDG
jgi:F0F1-type ATP synthase epsilon subunit